MKQLTCEMCGSTELVKEGGFFVCQTCGTKYSVEEAKKMMIEGTVDVQGTVKVDNSAFVEKYLNNARRAKQKEDWDETEKYYNMVEQNDPTNIEAIFYSAYGKAKKSLVDANIFQREATFKVLHKCVSVIDDNFSIEKEEEDRAIISQISEDILSMAGSSYVYNQTKNGNGVVSDDKMKTVILFNGLSKEMIVSLENIVKQLAENGKTSKIRFYLELAITQATYVMLNGSTVDPKSWYNMITRLRAEIKKFDPSYVIPTVENAGPFEFDNEAFTVLTYNNEQVNIRIPYANITKLKSTGNFFYVKSNNQPNRMFALKDKALALMYCDIVAERVRKVNPGVQTKNGGCYVATCVYGSYDCPQVWTLRRYRDDTLGSTWYGRLFIRTYYAISPTLVKWFGNTNWFKKLWKGKLDRMVAKLQAEGVENTPYEDKRW